MFKAAVQNDAVTDGTHRKLAHAVVNVIAVGVFFANGFGLTPNR